MTQSPALPRSGPVDAPARRALLLVLGAYLLLALAYGAVVPVFEQPDEHTHFFMAQQLAETGQLPVQPADEDARGPWEQQGSQPPLYYALAAPLLRLAGGRLDAAELWYNDQNSMGIPTIVGNENRFIHDPAVEGWPWRNHSLAVHLARLLSTLLGLATVWLVWWIARRVFPGHDLLAVAAAAVVALNPQFLAVHAALSNDPAVIVLATAALALTLRVAEGHDDWRSILMLAVVAGLAPLAKLSGLAVVGFVVLTLMWLAWRRRDLGWLLRTAGPVVAATLLLAGWWYLRNLQLYGDITGLNYMHPGGTKRHVSLGHWLEELPAELNGVWLSTWGLFGWFTLLLPDWVYALLTAASLAALVGLAVAWRRKVDWLAWPVLGWLALWGAVVFISLLRWLAYTKGGQGRLLFPAVALLGPLLVAGWRALLPRRVTDRALAATAGGALAVLAIGALVLVIRPAYALAERIPLAAIPATATRVDDVVFDGKLKLVAIEHPARVVEGEQLPVTLYWQALAPMTREGLVGLRVDQTVFAEGINPGTWPANLDAGRQVSGATALANLSSGTTPPRLLQAGPWAYVDRRLISSPDRPWNFQPTEGRLSVQLYDQSADSRWALDDSGQTTESASRLTIAPPDGSRNMLTTRDGSDKAEPIARFENGLALFGASNDSDGIFVLQDPPVFGDHAVWRASQPVREDLVAFGHLVNAAGHMVAQADSLPATAGYFPTSRWAAGDMILAAGPRIDPDRPLPPGTYRILTGLYRPTDGTRIPAYRADGSRWPDDAVVMGEVRVP